MKKNKSQKNIPDGWKVMKLGEVSNIFDGTHQTPDYKENGVPFYSVEHLTANNFTDTKYVSEEVFEQESKRVNIEKGDILMTRIGDVGTARYISWNARASFYVSLALIKCNKIVNSKFLTFFINSAHFQREIWGKTIHVAFPNKINLGDISKCMTVLPPLNEQKRIVAVLEVWDEMVEQLARKIEIKKNIKKGLADLLIFKRKDSKTFFIGDIFELGRGRVISKDEIRENIGEYPVYSSQTSNNGILGKINSFDFDGEYLTWTTDGANAGRVFCRNGKFNCTNVCGTAKLKKGNNVSLYFIATYLNYVTKHYVSYVGNPKLMNGVFGSIEVRLPELKEQKAIADILVTTDREIEKLEEKLKIIKEQKKFLLNNLITGQIRVPVGNE